jgi:hypothetical protein
MSRTFSTKSGSVESLNVSVRWGCRQKARQIRCTVAADTPEARAIERVLQCVASCGRLSNVVVTTCVIRSSSIRRGAPRARLVGQTFQACLGEATPPQRHGQPRDADPLGDGDIAQSFSRAQDDGGPDGVGPSDLPAARAPL